MLLLRMFRLCSVHARCNQVSILQESYKGYKVTGIRSLSTEPDFAPSNRSPIAGPLNASNIPSNCSQLIQVLGQNMTLDYFTSYNKDAENSSHVMKSTTKT